MITLSGHQGKLTMIISISKYIEWDITITENIYLGVISGEGVVVDDVPLYYNNG